MLSTADIEAARGLIADARRVLAITHVNPDGDAVGSLLGFGLAMRQLGKDVVLACADPVPDMFMFLPAAKEITMVPDGDFDLIVALDVSESARMGAIGKKLHHPPDLLFDHHITNPGFAKINLIDVVAASTAELVAELLPPLGLPLTVEIAVCLLTGLVTDTLGFRTANTTVKSLALAQQLIQAGAELHTIYDNSLFKRSFTSVRLWGEGLLRVQLKHRLVWTRLSLEARQAAGYQGSGDADLINVLSSIREADVAVIFVERPDKAVKVSWRSVPGLDVATIATTFGGGGHPGAAGAEIAGSLDEVEARVLTGTWAAIKAQRQAPAVDGVTA